jgi:predicted AAA+ superfamily ATPase
LAPIIQQVALDADKMALISGPRQAGKTTLAKQLLKVRGTG